MDFYVLLTIASASIFSAIGFFLWWLRKNDDYWEKRGIPYLPRVNFYATFKLLLSEPLHEIFLKAYKEKGRIYGAFEFRKPILTVCEPDLLKDILVKDFQAFNFRREIKSGENIIDKMVSILKGEDWKRVRTIISPAFTSRRMRQMSQIINECSQTVVQNFKKYAERNEPADVRSIFGAFTMDVIASSAFATKIDSYNDPENIFVKNVKKSFLTPSLYRLIVFFLIPLWLARKLRLNSLDSMDFFKNVVLKVIQERKEKGKKYNDILQLLLDAQQELENEKLEETKIMNQEDEIDQFGSVLSKEISFQKQFRKLSEDELLAQCVLFFLVGYETTASVLSHMAYALAVNTECQEKLIKEVDEAFSKNTNLDYDELRKMKYLDCVVSETLRMYPSLVRAERTACEDYKLGNTGIVIEKGTIVGFNIHAMHMDPEFFQNPEEFKPERFMPENANHPQYAYLPFGAGPRNCLGMRFALMEIKICMINILQHYTIHKAETTKVPLNYKLGQAFLSLNELPLIIKKREVRESEI